MVASLHTITHSRPSIRPMPVMMPAPWIASSYMPLAASGDSSRNGVPGSISRSTRSRGSSLPRAVCRSRERCRPAERGLGALARRAPARAPASRRRWRGTRSIACRRLRRVSPPAPSPIPRMCAALWRGARREVNASSWNITFRRIFRRNRGTAARDVAFNAFARAARANPEERNNETSLAGFRRSARARGGFDARPVAGRRRWRPGPRRRAAARRNAPIRPIRAAARRAARAAGATGSSPGRSEGRAGAHQRAADPEVTQERQDRASPTRSSSDQRDPGDRHSRPAAASRARQPTQQRRARPKQGASQAAAAPAASRASRRSSPAAQAGLRRAGRWPRAACRSPPSRRPRSATPWSPAGRRSPT